ncbi:ABC-2 family transporter protein [Nostoc sp. FACHB-110]|uniref:ABC transporter permease n=1 Tax=Nostoc sp. FACHB-110 TaxID=2692834 RepID=UPI00168400B7|nr:ABC-2 family transporter protein [Nostoc sp. FACHB-110]MBD2441485.1 ABC-2 family transporter protein [Nostoc sp. FACHB-110]
MKQILRKTWIFLSIYYAYMVEYRAELILWVLSGSLPIILMGVWIQAAQGGRFGLTSVDFARYFLTVFVVRQITVVWVIWEFEKEVLEGKLSPKLLQPIDPVWHHIASHLSERVARIPFAILLIVLFFLLYPQAVWLPNLSQILLFTLAVILAFILRFIIQYTFAVLAFWTERASALENLWFLFFLFLSGMVAPLNVFPEQVRNVVFFTPFPYLIDFPTSLLVGLPVNVVQGFMAMIGWILLLLGVNRLLWRAGLKRYSGMGA